LAGALYSIVIYPILYIFPAYAANGAPVIFGGKSPLDMKRHFRGKRIFGDHKTIRGTASSIIAGIAAGAIESVFIPWMLPVSILLTIGANAGDLAGSFLKRQYSIGSGRPVPLLDQYGFFIFALLFALPYGSAPTFLGLVFIFLLTGIMHPLTNLIAHMMKLKDVPW
jgi:CDP-2,3-bis-(O-geranylgeranyl)-sn-glycerol synthase